MSEPLENLYFNWLCAKVMRIDGVPAPSNTYWGLLRELHNTQFAWMLVGDDNRAEDGLDLRREFLIAADIPDDPTWRGLPCSLLEMLIAFSKRAEFMSGEPALGWFWEFMENLGLRIYTDAVEQADNEIAEVLYNLVWRNYQYSGHGGLFPLNEPPEDQTKTEIWYQFCEYLVDQERSP